MQRSMGNRNSAALFKMLLVEGLTILSLVTLGNVEHTQRSCEEQCHPDPEGTARAERSCSKAKGFSKGVVVGAFS